LAVSVRARALSRRKWDYLYSTLFVCMTSEWKKLIVNWCPGSVHGSFSKNRRQYIKKKMTKLVKINIILCKKGKIVWWGGFWNIILQWITLPCIPRARTVKKKRRLSLFDIVCFSLFFKHGILAFRIAIVLYFVFSSVLALREYDKWMKEVDRQLMFRFSAWLIFNKQKTIF
jgi:hypothetical protein